MKFVVSLCAVVLAVEGRPQEPQGTQSVLAAEFDKFHQLWVAEAQRNSVAPVNPFQTVSKPTALEAEPQAEVKAAEPIQETPAAPIPEEAVQQEVTQVAPVEVVPDMNVAFANFHALWQSEAARNAIAPMIGAVPFIPVAAPADPVAEEPAQVVPEVTLAVQEEQVVPVPAPMQEQVAPETLVAVTPDYQAELDAFQTLWQQEAARNAIAPVHNFQQVAAQQPSVVEIVAAPEVAPVAPVAATPAVVPSNLFGNLGAQPIIFVLPNWQGVSV